MTSTMKGFRCWSPGDIRQTVYSDIGALPSDADAVFLGAHTPMVLSHPRGEELPGAASGEGQVLEALLAGVGDPDRNTLIAVTGGSGTGKSHVVRWVHAHLDPADPRFHVLYVPRAVQTIRELLRRIVVGLPGGGGQELLERIDAALGQTTPAELRDRLLEEMRLALTWTLEQPLLGDQAGGHPATTEERHGLLGDPDEQGKRRNGLADLISLPQVNRRLLRDDGRLDRFVQSVYKQTSRRDEEQEGFTKEDLPLREVGVRRALGGNRDLSELWDLVQYEPKPALRVLDEALRQAVRRTLGLRTPHGETLDLLFRNSRQALRDEGRELVLLFEDLTQFGLVDGELYDQFVTQPGSTFAPLRVLFAVTDDPYQDLHETVRTRITHRFAVGPSSLADREIFVARYLNLVRVGRRDIEAAWAQAQRTGTDDWVKNACDTREDGLPCRFRDECHRGFGTVEVPVLGRVGLYPYNDVALRRALDGRGRHPTPRDILDACVRKTLGEADTNIAHGTYPHAGVREYFDYTVRQAREAVLRGRTGDDAERLYRALVLWGDEADLTPTVAEAFSLDASATREPGTSPPPEKGSPPAGSSKDTAGPTRPSPLMPLLQWQNGDRLPDEEADSYRDILHCYVHSRLDLDQDLFHTAKDKGEEILGELFNRTSFVLEDARGHKAGAGRVRFDLGRQAEDVRVLMSARWFADHAHWNPEAGWWPWPEGYDPVELMLSLECRLEQWADTVRRAFRDRVRGRTLARAALGTRAVALLVTGLSPEQVGDVGEVLSAGPRSLVPSTPGWADAHQAAQDVLRTVSAVDRVGQFAAVRQGDTGSPQLVDAAELESGLQQAHRAPVEYLRWVVQEAEDADPALTARATKLLSALEQASPGLLREVTAAVDELAAGLEGAQPAAVGRMAREVGKRALDTGLFRPAEGWNAFTEALDTLEALPSELPLDWRHGNQERDAEEALRVQHWARDAVVGAQSLAVVRQSLAATRAECTRSGSPSGDLDQRRQQVRQKLRQVEEHLQVLSTAEAGRG
ncbi:MAG: hypothetical protein ACRDRV_22130 [Pseudonocardiaceae bacterium]